MSALTRRLAALERSEPEQLTPALKAWFGHALTDAEQKALARDRARETEPFDWRSVDTSDWSKEAQAWWHGR